MISFVYMSNQISVKYRKTIFSWPTETLVLLFAHKRFFLTLTPCTNCIAYRVSRASTHKNDMQIQRASQIYSLASHFYFTSFYLNHKSVFAHQVVFLVLHIVDVNEKKNCRKKANIVMRK